MTCLGKKFLFKHVYLESRRNVAPSGNALKAVDIMVRHFVLIRPKTKRRELHLNVIPVCVLHCSLSGTYLIHCRNWRRHVVNELLKP